MQLRKKMVRSALVVLTVVSSLALLGCPGDDEEEVRNVATTIPLNASTAAGGNTAVLNGAAFTVPGSVLATAASTPALQAAFQNATPTLSFANVSGANGSFTTANPTTSGTVVFASCTFTITSPANLAGTIFIQNCSVTVSGTAAPVGGGTVTGTEILVLNGTSSTSSVPVQVQLTDNGQLIVTPPSGTPVTTTFTVTGTTGG